MPFQPGNKLGGRPKSMATLRAQKIREEISKRVHEELGDILDAQLGNAKGLTILISRRKVKQDDGSIKRTGKFYMVSDPQEVIDLMNEENPNDYYKITTATPNIKAAGYLIDQAAGKATQTIEMPGVVESLAELVTKLNESKDQES